MSQNILYVNFFGYLLNFVLPTENNRTYEIDLSKTINYTNCKITLEYFDSIWTVISNGHVNVLDNNSILQSRVLSTNKPTYCQLDNSVNFSLLLDTLSEDHLHYQKYDIRKYNEIVFGKDECSHIVLQNEFISNTHASLIHVNNEWFIEDHSRNGLYLNNQRIPSESRVKLRMFDTIYTGGFHIIFLKDCIAINHAKYVSAKLNIYSLTADNVTKKDHLPYLRSPRMQEPLPDDVIEIESPPSKQSHKKQPLFFVLGPALTTPLPMLTTMMLRMNTGTTGSDTYWIMGVSVVMSAAIGLGWTLARRKYDSKEELATENQRQEAYSEYLVKNEKLLMDRHDECRKRMLEQYPTSDEIAGDLFSDNLSRFLWNRNPKFSDFSCVRLGVGDIVIPGGIQVPKERFSVTNDLLAEEPMKLKDKYKIITHVPALIKLSKHKLIGLIGDDNSICELICNITIQLATLHSYTDLRMAFLYDESESELYRWTRWLQHTYTQDKKLRMLGENEELQQNTLSYLLDLIRKRAKKDADDTSLKLPLYVVFCTQPELLYNHSIYKAMTDMYDYGMIFILAYGKMDFLPNECTYLIQSDNEYHGHYSLEHSRDTTNVVSFDYIKPTRADHIARKLSNYWVNEVSDGEIPDRVEFLEMYGISDIHEWDLLKKWKESRTYENIRGQIGYTYGRHPIYLDIHEKQHGPHGLVAGTTGSGKSETLQTFILSLMLNYHPDEVSFVLIDYKGGGMANLFANVPHIAGMITNISASGGDSNGENKTDPIQTQRALASLKSEIKQRQKIFNTYGVNHIDAYNHLYRDGVTSIAIPHLIIISDEFAELKKEQPEFIKELVSTARVGRSLGIHLILATQKPSGVVDDEIWSNSRFKLCLRVQDRQDSMEMLKRPEAAELTRIGQGYLQIGNDESFELFQSGYSGSPYQPESDLNEKRQNEVEMITLGGSRIRKNILKSHNGFNMTQLEACIEYIRKITKENGIKNTRSLWLSMLSSEISLESLMKQVVIKNNFTAIVGKIDYPEQQSQPIFTLKYSQCGHVLIVGNSGSGKSALISSIICSLCCGQAPELFNWYAIDFSNHAFDGIKNTPHCGGIVYPEEDEKIERIFLHLETIMKQRKKLLASSGILTAEEYRSSKADPMPLILVAIDNYASFFESHEKYVDILQRLLREGIAYGIHFIVSINAASDMRNKVSQNFATAIPLLLNERSDYYNYLGASPQIAPMGFPGSGLCRYQNSIVQFQSAFVSNDAILIEKAPHSHIQYRAAPIRYIDKSQTYAEYLSVIDKTYLQGDHIPLGWYTKDITPYCLSLSKTFCYFISDVVGASYSSVLTNIIAFADVHNIELHYVCTNRTIIDSAPSAHVYSSSDDIFELMSYLRNVFKERSDALKAYKAQGGTDSAGFISQTYNSLLVIFEDYNAFCNTTYTLNSDRSYKDAYEIFLKNGKGFGITFIAVWNKALYSQNFTKPACQLFLESRTGMHLGGKLDSQKAIETNLSIAEQSKIRLPETGYALDSFKVHKVYIPPCELSDTKDQV